MKICVCCSLSFPEEAKKVSDELEKLGHEVILPTGILLDAIHKPGFDPVLAKSDKGDNDVREHLDKIKDSDVVLVCNFTKNGVDNYIGANTFLEMGFAYYIRKPVYALNPLPDYKYINDEILSFGIIVLDNDLTKIV